MSNEWNYGGFQQGDSPQGGGQPQQPQQPPQWASPQQPQQPYPMQPMGNHQVQHYQQGAPVGQAQKSKTAALILAAIPLTAGLGIHDFYLGNTTRALIRLVLTILSAVLSATVIFGVLGGIVLFVWWIVDIIFIATGGHGYDKDANGIPLR